MKKSLLVVLSAIMIVSLALAGCTPSSSGGGGEGGSNILVWGRGADSTSLDPAIVTDGESFKVTQNIYDTLVTYKGQTTEVVPSLAKEWKVSDDGLTYTFHLREGVKFHNGEEFTADAVVFNFKRWKSGEGNYAYYTAMFGGYKDKSTITSVKAIDKYTVQFKLKHPMAPFLKNLAMSPFAIASPKAIKKYGDKYGKEAAVGTGPFKFKGWKSNSTVTLVKNEDFWRKGQPKMDKIIFQVIKDNTARLNALKKGQIDIMDGVNPSDLKDIKKNKDLEIFKRPPMNVGYLGINTQYKQFKDPLVRRALSYAVDKEQLIKAFYAGNAVPAKNPMPPNMMGYNKSIDAYEYNLDKAKKLLKKAGYPNGFKTELWVMPNPRPYMPKPTKIGEAIAHNFEQIGLKVEIKTAEWTTYLEKTDNGKAPMFLLGWIGDNGDPDNFLYTLLYSESGNNSTQYDSAKVDKLLEKAQRLTDKDKRAKLYKKAQEIIHKDAPMIPLVHAQSVVVGEKHIDGYQPHPTGTEQLRTIHYTK